MATRRYVRENNDATGAALRNGFSQRPTRFAHCHVNMTLRAKGRPAANSEGGRYVRSFLFLRLTIGLLGVLLPLALVTLDWLAFHGHPGSTIPRGSMSAYYYSGWREVFTATIGTIAFFLFVYKITERNLDNLLSMIAGLAGMMIPLFPTGIPGDITPAPKLTPIQHGLSEDWTKYVHFGASAVFIGFLGGICVLFGRREGERKPHGNIIPGHYWRWFHVICAVFIGGAGTWILLTTRIPPFRPGHSRTLLLAPDRRMGVATAFGASWFAKGAEIRYLFFGRDEPGKAGPQTAPAATSTY